MAYVIAMLMAGLSFICNRLFMRYIGPVTVISLGPVSEEASKTLFAYYLGADIIAVHAIFGTIEAVLDWYQSGRLTAAVLSIAGHTLFGAITASVLFLAGSIWLGLLAGILLHVIYNVSVVRLMTDNAARKSGKRENP